jgi:hypothetical protein
MKQHKRIYLRLNSYIATDNPFETVNPFYNTDTERKRKHIHNDIQEASRLKYTIHIPCMVYEIRRIV